MMLIAKTRGGAFLHGLVLGFLTGIWTVCTILFVASRFT